MTPAIRLAVLVPPAGWLQVLVERWTMFTTTGPENFRQRGRETHSRHHPLLGRPGRAHQSRHRVLPAGWHSRHRPLPLASGRTAWPNHPGPAPGRRCPGTRLQERRLRRSPARPWHGATTNWSRPKATTEAGAGLRLLIRPATESGESKPVKTAPTPRLRSALARRLYRLPPRPRHPAHRPSTGSAGASTECRCLLNRSQLAG